MAAIDKILGQSKLLETIDRFIELGKRGQALLFTGPPGIGKFALTVYTAQRFLCQKDFSACGDCFSCKSITNFNHPDFLLVFPFPNVASESKRNTVFHFSDPVNSNARFSNETLDEVNRYTELKKQDPYRLVTFKKKENIPVSVIKDLIKAVAKRPMMGKRRVVAVCDIDLMAFGAADLFLKTVEEPPEDSLIILTTSKLHYLQPTLVSRTIKFSLSPVNEKLVADFLSKYDLNGSLEFYIRYCSGSPGLALKACEDELVNRRNEIWKIFAEFIYSKSISNTTETLRQRYRWVPRYEDVRSDFNVLEKLLRDLYIAKLGLDKILINIDIKDQIIKYARMAPAAEVLQRWFENLAKASKVHRINNVSADIAFIGAFIEFSRALK